MRTRFPGKEFAMMCPVCVIWLAVLQALTACAGEQEAPRKLFAEEPQPLRAAAETFAPPAADLKVHRFSENPIIRPEMLPEGDGANINGPSLIRVPSWLPHPLGKYYLYFAHHNGKYIRLAYADQLAGPWTIHRPGVLRLEQTPDGIRHIASPDVHVDDARKEIRMYFHCPSKTRDQQLTYAARSVDGLEFMAGAEPLAPSYLRVFPYGGYWYGIAKPGLLFRSPDGWVPFEPGHNVLPAADLSGRRVRHVAVDRMENQLHVYYTNVGDAPECILRAVIGLTPDWKEWRAGSPERVLMPGPAYEGGDLPVKASSGGKTTVRENGLRDPAIYKEEGHTYLLYAVAGESGIAIAELLTGGP